MSSVIWDYKGIIPIGISAHRKYSIHTDLVDGEKYIFTGNGVKVYNLSGFINVNDFIKRDYGISVGDSFYVSNMSDTKLKNDTKYTIESIGLYLRPYGGYDVDIFFFTIDGVYMEISYNELITIDDYRNSVIDEVLN